jgi:acetyl-CoA acetyltransferase family protein
VFVAGGVESMTRAPVVMLKSGTAWSREAPQVADSTVGWRFVNPRMDPQWTIPLGATAERVAATYGITRQEQDGFAVESQRRAARAAAEHVFDDEIVGVPASGAGGSPLVACDEHPRPDTSPAALAALKPAFAADGTVTAGNASGVSDGAAALAIVSDRGLGGRRPLARIVASAVAGVDPSVMGMGPVPAVRTALRRAGLDRSALDLVELNEAFASQALACIRELELDADKVNVHGGAIALGHPLGASGARLLVTLVHALRRRGGRYGLATMCIGVGQGIAVVVERL